MAHAVVNDSQARIIEQCTQGRKTRNVVCRGLVIDTARSTHMADAIKSETAIIPFFIAPCDSKVVRITVNGTPYADMASGGTVTVKLTKAVIGTTDVDLCSAISIGEATLGTLTVLDTAIDGTLSTTSGALNLLEGQHVFATVTVSAHDCDAAGYVTLMMEWVATDSPNG